MCENSENFAARRRWLACTLVEISRQQRGGDNDVCDFTYAATRVVLFAEKRKTHSELSADLPPGSPLSPNAAACLQTEH